MTKYDFNFPILNFPFIPSNIPATPAYGVYTIYKLIRYSRACGSYYDLIYKVADVHVKSRGIRVCFEAKWSFSFLFSFYYYFLFIYFFFLSWQLWKILHPTPFSTCRYRPETCPLLHRCYSSCLMLCVWKTIFLSKENTYCSVCGKLDL